MSRKTKKTALPTATLLILVLIAAIYLALRFTVLQFHEALNLYDPASPYGSSVVVRLLTFSKVLWTYFGLMLFPYPLHMERDIEPVLNLFSVWPFVTFILLTGLIILGWYEHKRQKSHWIWLGSAWFLGMLLPVSGIFPINGILYEHWLYVPLVGFLIGGNGLIKLLPITINQNLKTVILATILGAYMVLTWRQNYIWGTPTRFYSYTLQFGESARLHNNLAMAYADEKQYQLAITHYKKAIEIDTLYPQTHYNLGNTYADLGELDRAIVEYEAAIKLGPNFQPAKVALLKVYLNQEKYENALRITEELLLQEPENSQLLKLKNFLQGKSSLQNSNYY